jgi:23S rRNA (cytidine1920-2'-O)/16S rRNA (cytidine1409-2'-O)-methyltransferase
VSFISLKHVLPAVSALVARQAQLVALIKPQFEVSRRQLKKGIVREPSVHATVCEDIANFISSLGWSVGKTVPSAIPGGDGNHEFFIEAARE